MKFDKLMRSTREKNLVRFTRENLLHWVEGREANKFYLCQFKSTNGTPRTSILVATQSTQLLLLLQPSLNLQKPKPHNKQKFYGEITNTQSSFSFICLSCFHISSHIKDNLHNIVLLLLHCEVQCVPFDKLLSVNKNPGLTFRQQQRCMPLSTQTQLVF